MPQILIMEGEVTCIDHYDDHPSSVLSFGNTTSVQRADGGYENVIIIPPGMDDGRLTH